MSSGQHSLPEVPVTIAARRRQRLRIETIGSLVTLAVLIAAPFTVRSFVVFQFTTIIVYGIAIMSLNILTGWSGQFSLGHSAFFAVGAYVMGILVEQANVHYALALPLAGAACFVFGFLFGLPALRLSGIYLALATFSLAIAMPQFLKLAIFEHWTGGVQGLVITKPDAPFGLRINQDIWLYYVALAVALLLYLFSVNLIASRSGRALLAIRDHQIAASAMGINLALYKTLAFGLSAAMTGIAGGLGAILFAFVSPDAYSITFATNLFIGMVIGGVGWLPGSLAGAAFLVLIPNLAEGISKGLPGALFGVFVLAVIFFFPDGAKQIAQLCARGIRRLFGTA